MSACYEKGFLGKSPASGSTGPIVALRTGTRDIRLLQVMVAVTGSGTAAGERLALYRTSALGTANTSAVGDALDPAEAASLTNVDTNWSANPTITGQPLRNRHIGANSFDWITWRWDVQGGLVVPASSSVVLWRETSPAAVMSSTFGTIGWEE